MPKSKIINTEYALKPCPFCYGKAQMRPYYYVKCPVCRSESGIYKTEAEAAAAWNKRKDAFS